MRAFFLLFALCVLCFFSGIASRDIGSRGESREVLVAQAMFSTGNLISPKGYGGDVPSKPPFLHWLVAASALVVGEVNEVTARLPNAVLGTVFILCFFVFLRRRESTANDALFIAAALLFSFEWLRHASLCRVDMALAASLAGSWLSLYSWWERKLAKVPATAVLLLSGATLAKGPVALVLTAGIFGAFLLVQREPLRRVLKSLGLVIIPAGIIAGTWYVAALLVGGSDFWNKFYYENVQRFSGTMEDEPHKHGLWYHPVMLFAGLLPMSLLLCSRTWPFPREVPKKLLELAPLKQFAIIAALLTLIFFSIPSSKRGVYLLPSYPFWCILLAPSVRNIPDRLKAALWTSGRWVLLALGALCLTQGVWQKLLSPELQAIAERYGYSQHAFLCALGLLGLGYFALRLSRRSEQTLLLGALVVAMVQSSILGGLVNAVSSKPFADELRKSVQELKYLSLYSFRTEFYGLSFYLARRIDRLPAQLPDEEFLVLAEKSKLSGFAEAIPGRTSVVVAESTVGLNSLAAKVVLIKVPAKALQSSEPTHLPASEL